MQTQTVLSNHDLATCEKSTVILIGVAAVGLDAESNASIISTKILATESEISRKIYHEKACQEISKEGFRVIMVFDDRSPAWKQIRTSPIQLSIEVNEGLIENVDCSAPAHIILLSQDAYMEDPEFTVTVHGRKFSYQEFRINEHGKVPRIFSQIQEHQDAWEKCNLA
jgi:hypothetical protein